MSQSLHAIAKGKVQGVGFRYSAIELASKLGIQGTVKNLPNGNVEIIAQGEASHLVKFFDELQEMFDTEIEKTPIDTIEKHSTFKITY